MDNNQKRLNISISFSNKNATYEKNKKIYDYVNNKPNSSHYIRELVKKDMDIQRKKKSTSFEENIDVNNFVDSIFNM